MNSYSWDQLHVGLDAGFDVTVDDAMMERFLATTGDANPLHLDADYATGRGFRSRVVYGLLTASFYSTLAGVHLPGQRCLLHGVKADFNAPVYVGDRLRVRGTIAHLSEAYRQIDLACEITNQRAEVVSKARLRCGLDRH
ncbi:MAG: 3-hydroxybutyryl-CoA dehydratase [Myxococcales bacterium]|nr:3-hydroxybutyryl-CoA dehydratase [Myxococcales bacterium]